MSSNEDSKDGSHYGNVNMWRWLQAPRARHSQPLVGSVMQLRVGRTELYEKAKSVIYAKSEIGGQAQTKFRSP